MGKIKTVLKKIGTVLSLLFILFFLFSVSYLCLTSGNSFLVVMGVLILPLIIWGIYLTFEEEISSLFTLWREKKKEREKRKKKVVQEISPPSKKRKKETKVKKIEPETPISVERRIEKVPSKGEIMRELGLTYEKLEKTEIKKEKEIKPAISQLEKDKLLKRKRLDYLQSTGIAQLLIEKGKLEISEYLHIGQMRGADIAEKLIRPILRDFNIEVLIKHHGGKRAEIFLEERERQKLREEIEKLRR